ncbi:SpoIIE family protein phosphatase, partial [Kaarinaea lacus]
LATELLRVVNSSFYSLGRELKSLTRAISIVGQRALRNIVLCLAVRDLINNGSIVGFDVTAFWEHALRRAVSARLLGTLLDYDADDCFTIGLIQDFGLLAMFYLHPTKADVWQNLATADPDSRLDLENQHFACTHDQLGRQLAQTWQLPEEFALALGNHHSVIGDSCATDLSKLLYCSDWMTAVFSSDNKGGIIDQCRCVLDDMFAISNNDINDLLTAVPKQTAQAASMLGLKIDEQIDFEQVLREANIKLAEANLSYQELTWELEKTLQERDRLAAELNRELELAREIQQSLLPQTSTKSFPITGINVSARQLSGDFFDYFELPDGKLYFNLGDVSGKGMNAALLMAKTSSLFRCLGKKVYNPGDLLALINNEICETTVRGMFVTMIAGIYDANSDILRMVNAGNPPGLLFDRNGKIRLFEAQTPPLGVVPGLKFPEIKCQLNSGSLYLFSDGVTETQLADGHELGIKGLARWLKDSKIKPPQQRLQAIVERLTPKHKPLRDDITLMLIEQ